MRVRCDSAIASRLRKRKNEEEDIITAVIYDCEGEWNVKYAVDRKEYRIEFSSLDADFMRNTVTIL